MTLHTYTPLPMSLPSINLLHLTVPEIQAGQTFPAAHLPSHPDTMGENNTPTALKGCGVITPAGEENTEIGRNRLVSWVGE